MKKLIKSLIFVFAFASISFAQEANQIAESQGATALTKSKLSGDYVFTMPSNLTAEDVSQNSKYYTLYFTVNFDEGSKKASIHMLDNSPKARFVICRFFTACGVQYVEVDDVNLDLTAFTEKYLQ